VPYWNAYFDLHHGCETSLAFVESIQELLFLVKGAPLALFMVIGTTMTQQSQEPKQASSSTFLWLLIGLAVLLAAGSQIRRVFFSAPAPIAVIGPWSLIDQNGKDFGDTDLKGKVWVADFMFTRCPSICADLTRQMVEIDSDLKEFGTDVHLVSFSVDPDHDSPEVMRDYMKKFSAQDDRWTFLTGEKAAIHTLLTDKMPFHVGERKPLTDKPKTDNPDTQSELYEISHMGKFAVFDRQGNLRRVVGTTKQEYPQLRNAVEMLLEESLD
jgi:protein SCO1